MENLELVVLMYHAVPKMASDCSGADPYYSVSQASFAQQVSLLRGAGINLTSVERIRNSCVSQDSVALTFDDGHESNYEAALALAAAGGSADLFINTSMVGSKTFVTWAQLTELSRMGISIQSHGHTHRYFDGLSEFEIELELATSRHLIEDRLGVPVTLFAPPGGRLRPQVSAIALRAGYAGICTSRPGLWRLHDGAWNIPRFAVQNSTPHPQVMRWASKDKWELLQMAGRYQVLSVAKSVLGNQFYEFCRMGIRPMIDRSAKAK